LDEQQDARSYLLPSRFAHNTCRIILIQYPRNEMEDRVLTQGLYLVPNPIPRTSLWLRCVCLAGWAVWLVIVGQQFPSQVDASTRPNILFIAVDDMRCELGCYGATHVHSPNIDRLASSGVLFRRAYCQQAVCNPSRVSLMTGMRPDSTKVWDLVTEMRSVIPDVVTLPQHFRQHGYRAVAYGKIFHNPFPDAASWDEPTHNAENVVAHSEANRDRLAEFRVQMKADGKSQAAIDRMRGPATEIQEQPDEKNFDGKQTSDALQKMRDLSKGNDPFFLAVGYIRPHLPFITPKPYWDLYNRQSLPLAENPFLPENMPPVAFGDRNLGGFYELRGYMDYADAPSPFERVLSESQQRELKHGYYASVSFIDAQVGRLLAGLEELGLEKNTIVVLWSDHGWKLGEHGSWCKQTNLEIDTRAPLMIRAPGAKANGTQTDAIVEFIDIYPTLCELAGVPIRNSLEGISLKPLLDGSQNKVKDVAISQFPRKHDGRDYMGYAMRSDRYRYVEWIDAKSGAIEFRELYDHVQDAMENRNLAGNAEHRELLQQLSQQLWQTIPRPSLPYPFVQSVPDATKNPGAMNSSTLTWYGVDKALPASRPAGEYLSVTFVNTRPEPVQLLWIGADNTRRKYATLEENGTFSIRTRPGAVWLVQDSQQREVGHFVIESRPEKTAKALIPKP
jgi:arylsulfatase A-like enzyme